MSAYQWTVQPQDQWCSISRAHGAHNNTSWGNISFFWPRSVQEVDGDRIFFFWKTVLSLPAVKWHDLLCCVYCTYIACQHHCFPGRRGIPQIRLETAKAALDCEIINFLWASFVFATLVSSSTVFPLPLVAHISPAMFNFIVLDYTGLKQDVAATWSISVTIGSRFSGRGRPCRQLSLPNKFYCNHEVIILCRINLYSTFCTEQSSVRSVINPHWKQGCSSRLDNACWPIHSSLKHRITVGPHNEYFYSQDHTKCGCGKPEARS